MGEWESEEFRKECEDLEGWKYTKYLGSVRLDKVYKYTKRADVGICILYPKKDHINSLSTKIFEYMACSLPVVLSNFSYWRRMFGECALFVDPYDPKDIADKILYLLDNPDKARRLGGRGRQLIEGKYNWETEASKLTGLYRELLT